MSVPPVFVASRFFGETTAGLTAPYFLRSTATRALRISSDGCINTGPEADGLSQTAQYAGQARIAVLGLHPFASRLFAA